MKGNFGLRNQENDLQGNLNVFLFFFTTTVTELVLSFYMI